MAHETVSDYEELLLSFVPKDGSTIGNAKLIKMFLPAARKRFSNRVSEDRYWQTRDELVDTGILSLGRGRGGSVYLAEPHETPASSRKEKRDRSEAALYEPFLEVIRESWTKMSRIQDFVIQKTAMQGKRKTGGKWTRPDICLVAVRVYPYLPGKILDVVTFELKRAKEWSVEGVYETAAHSVFAHKSYLSLHLPKGRPESEEFTRMAKHCDRFGVGLLIFSDVYKWDTYEVIVDPERKNPDPYDVNEFISKQMNAVSRDRISQLLR